MEPALIDSMAAKIEATVRRRYEAEMAQRQRAGQVERQGQGGRLTLAIVSVVMGIPLTAIIAGTGMGLPAMLVVWTGIVLVNMAYAMRRPPSS